MLKEITSTGSIIAYNKSFEITQIKNLALACLDINDELDYKKLGSIQNGGDAMDTLAMVRIWEKLYKLKDTDDRC